MFSIHNFEDHISKTILDRGKDYYDNGCVKKIKESGKGNWEARVDGTDKYEVALILKKNDVINYDCDCPYDGDVCKHVVALLYYLKEKLTVDIKPKKTVAQKKTVSKRFSFENLLDVISLKEYKDFIGYYATFDKDFKTNFELYFSHKDSNFNIEKTYTPLIKKLVRKYTEHGFMDYRSCRAFANEIHLIIKTANDYFTKDNFRDSLALAKVLIRETTKPIEWCDDSSGMLGDTISNTIDLLNEMVASTAVPFPIKEQISTFLNEELKNSLYFDYANFGYEMTHVFFNSSKLTANYEVFLTFIDKKIEDYRHTDYREFFTTEKITFLQAVGKITEAKALISQNMDITEVRASEVNKYVEKEDYAQAKTLINEGIAIAEKKRHDGTVYYWKKELYIIAMLQKDILAMREYAKILAFDYGFEPEYYNRWKSTFISSEWTKNIESYIEVITHKVTENHNKAKDSYYKTPLHIDLLESLSDIYIQEEYTDRILGLIKTGFNLNLLVTYHNILLAEYATDLLELYPIALDKECETANSRSDYKSIANVMKKIIKTIPKSKAVVTAIVEKLIQQYPRRPAMIDEFNKV